MVVICGGGGGGLPFLPWSGCPLSNPGYLHPHVWVFFAFLFLGLWNQINNKQSKEGNNQWVVVRFVGCILLQSKKNNQIKQSLSTKLWSFVNKVWRNSWFCVLCCVCKHPFRIIDIVSSSFQEKISCLGCNLERHIVQDTIRVWGAIFGKAHCSKQN